MNTLLLLLLLNSTAQEGLDAVNYYRAIAGLPLATLDAKLTKACENHANYIATNHDDPRYKNMSWHSEVAGLPGYTGGDHTTRAANVGFTECCLGENIAYAYNQRTDAFADVTRWMETVYHRFPIIKPHVKSTGFAMANDGGYVWSVQLYYHTGSDGTQYRFYPVPNQKNVPLQFSGNETPDPFPGARYPVGYPITVYVPDSLKARTRYSDYSISDKNGTKLEVLTVDPNNSYMDKNFAMVTTSPLKPNETYKVYIKITYRGNDTEYNYSFTTADTRAITTVKPSIAWNFYPEQNLVTFSSDNYQNPLEISIYNLKGQLQKQLIAKESTSWNADVPQGVYFIRMKQQSSVLNDKIVIY